MKSKFLLVGDTKGKRINTFVDCLKHMDITDYKIISWKDVIEDSSIIQKDLSDNTIIKIEPPEKDLYIYKSFLKKGISKGILNNKDIEKINFEKCPIVAPSQWYEGVREVFLEIESILNHNRNVFSMINIEESLIMMDKERTYNFLSGKEKKFNLPEKLKSYKSYEQFKNDTGDRNLKCFIKLRHGSGSEGVIAYSNNKRLNEECIYTSLAYSKDEDIFFSTYKVNCYKDSEIIKKMIDWVLKNDAHIEAWIPKAKYIDKVYDTRAIVIDNKVEYLLSRLSRTPITNLHLKNERKESKEFMDTKTIDIIENASKGVMNLFENSFMAGIDVVMSKKNKPYIIDVNPFGDLLHHLIGTDKNIYYKEIKSAIAKLGDR
ncbi:MAG TPA: hypothetical protein DCL31_13620 [Clostridium sp.]|nr:hypothetical protein [Clostridium sp.]